jgi:hypothetical protein
MVEQTLKEEGVLGARIMGGGFGGCSINLIKDENVNQVIENITAQYKQAYNIDMKVYKVKYRTELMNTREMKSSFNQKIILTEDTIRFWTSGFWFLRKERTDLGRDRPKKHQKNSFRLTIRIVIYARKCSD